MTTDAALNSALASRLLALADDEMILAHRNSEWTGHAPILEEDIAFSNIAQDEMGHAKIWYALSSELTGDDPDRLVFFRDAADYRNVQMMALPKGDWAFTVLRQYLFDAAEMVWLPRLAGSAYQPIAHAAAKIRPEEMYHYRHTHHWVKRLGLGTAESNRRMQRALDELWPYALQLFTPLPGDGLLLEAGYFPPPAELRATWEESVIPFLEAAGLQLPDVREAIVTSREEPGPYLADLLAEMQEVARRHPEAKW